jgi:hypothetical protein
LRGVGVEALVKAFAVFGHLAQQRWAGETVAIGGLQLIAALGGIFGAKHIEIGKRPP